MLLWPPALPPERKKQLLNLALDWAHQNGMVVKQDLGVVHVPFSLFPSPFPRDCFDFAYEIAPLFNELFDRVSRDWEFIDQVMKSIKDSDEFTRKIYEIFLKTRSNSTQKTILGVHRSDYLLHWENNQPFIKQVEFNTIAASFSSLSSKTAELHQYLSSRTDFYNDHAPGYLDIKPENLPSNESGRGIAYGIAKAHQLYRNKDAYVLMVVQPGERNVFDQRLIELELFNTHGVKLMRRSLFQVNETAQLVERNGFKELVIDSITISVVYFRSGYAPTDYPSENDWKGRELIEISHAIKCPNAAYHLVGSKKIQQVLALDGMVEK